MTYTRIRPCAFMPGPQAQPFVAEFSALAFPPEWRTGLLDLYRHGRRNPDQVRSVPVRRFRQLLHALAPELIALTRDASPGDADPLLYCARPFSAPVLRALVAAWAADLPKGEDAAGPLRDTMLQLQASDLQWTRTPVDLVEQSVTAGGTAGLAERLYALLPEFLARRIAAHGQYQFEGVQLRFVQAPPNQRGAAELVSWPPRTFLPPRGKRGWHFSLYLRISLQTVPFEPQPRIHIHSGVRRWESHRKVRVPPGDRVSVYLAADAPWIDGAPAPQEFRFGKGGLAWSRGKIGWAVGGPEDILRRLTFANEFPDPEVLVKDPGAWLDGPGGITAAVVYGTAMEKTHGVGAGLMPRDRAPLHEWVAEALAPEFVPVPDLVRSTMPARPARTPARTAGSAGPLADARGDGGAAASARRAQLAHVLADRNFNADVFCQTSAIRDAILQAATADLGLAGTEIPGEANIRAWRTSELDIQLRLHDLGALGSGLLLDGEVPATRDQRDAAIAERRVTVARHMATLPPGSSLAFAEIDRPGKFAGPLADPKIAMRLGFADASVVSQFLHPPDDEADGADDTVPHRALAAWQDGLRQAGLASLPQHSLGGQIPGDLQYLAVWIVRKNRSGPTGHTHFLPVAVLMRPETPGALGITPRLSQWLPYGELLQAIGQHGTIEESWAREAAQAAAERFIRQVLYMVRSRPTLLLTNAQNIRSWWPSLTNSAVIRDQVGFAGSMSPAALYGPGLRHVRVRHAESFETPQWFAPNETTGRPGLAEGLWLPADAGPGNRVFGSTTAKPATAMHAAVSASKLVPRSGERPRVDTGQQAWNPSLLEITVLACTNDDNPEAFAALTHQLRISPDHSDALKLPVPLHLASLAAEYVLHAEEREA